MNIEKIAKSKYMVPVVAAVVFIGYEVSKGAFAAPLEPYCESWSDITTSVVNLRNEGYPKELTTELAFDKTVNIGQKMIVATIIREAYQTEIGLMPADLAAEAIYNTCVENNWKTRHQDLVQKPEPTRTWSQQNDDYYFREPDYSAWNPIFSE